MRSGDSNQYQIGTLFLKLVFLSLPLKKFKFAKLIIQLEFRLEKKSIQKEFLPKVT